LLTSGLALLAGDQPDGFNKRRGSNMKSNLRAILSVIGVAAVLVSPALAAAKHHVSTPTPSFNTCEALSVERGVSPLQGGNSSNPYAQYDAFMRACLEGKIPVSSISDTLGQFRRAHQGN
jgi:hypothetical protein